MRVHLTRAVVRLGVASAAFAIMAIANTRTAAAATSDRATVAMQISTCAGIGCYGGTHFCADYYGGGWHNCYDTPEPQ